MTLKSSGVADRRKTICRAGQSSAVTSQNSLLERQMELQPYVKDMHLRSIWSTDAARQNHPMILSGDFFLLPNETSDKECLHAFIRGKCREEARLCELILEEGRRCRRLQKET